MSVQTIDQVAETVEAEILVLPIYAVNAALQVVDRTDERYGYVYVHKHEGKLRIIGTDGSRLVITDAELPSDTPSWLKAEQMVGVSAAKLKPRLPLLIRESVQSMLMAYVNEGRSAHVSDPIGADCFRLPVETRQAFPYDQVITSDAFSGGDPFEPVTVNPKLLKQAGDVTKALETTLEKHERRSNGSPIRYYQGQGHATIFDFPQFPGTMLVLARMRAETSQHVGQETARMAKSAAKGTLAALKAHATRNEKYAEEAADEPTAQEYRQKAQEYRQKIESIEQATTPQVEAAPEADQAADSEAEAQASEQAAEQPSEATEDDSQAQAEMSFGGHVAAFSPASEGADEAPTFDGYVASERPPYKPFQRPKVVDIDVTLPARRLADGSETAAVTDGQQSTPAKTSRKAASKGNGSGRTQARAKKGSTAKSSSSRKAKTNGKAGSRKQTAATAN